MFLLDTDHISIIQDQVQPQFARLDLRMNQHSPSAFFVSVVSVHEQTLGVNAYINQANSAQRVSDGYDLFLQLLDFYCAMQVLAFDVAASAIFGSLRSQKVRVSTMDLRISAIALSRKFTVLTRNLGDFRQVPGLISEDWTA